ncbi:MAG: glycosyltransferase [Wujia sp.]
MNTFLVLMSVFNCEDYICDQLDSILNQKNVDVNILIRNNGSTDNTSTILSEYCEANPAATFFDGKNCSEDASLFRLFEVAEGSYDYYAIINPYERISGDYLANICSRLSGEENAELPLLYCSPYKSNNPESLSVYRTKKPVDTISSPENVLVNDLSCISAIAFNQALLGSLKIPMPNGLTTTGHWITIVAALYGKIIYDTTSEVISTKEIYRPKRFSKEVLCNLFDALNRIYKLPDFIQKQISIVKNSGNSFGAKLKCSLYMTFNTDRL